MAPLTASTRPKTASEYRQRQDETRARIIDAALDLIADHGFAATSTRQISEQLGFTKAALYYHFRTKDDLLEAIVEPVLDDLASLCTRATPASAVSDRRRVVEGYVAIVARHVKLIRVLSGDPAVHRYRSTVTSILERLMAILAGVSEPDASQRTRARAALGAIDAAIVRADVGEDLCLNEQTALDVACAILGL